MDKLRKRRDFLAAAKAERSGVASLLLQGRNRRDDGEIRLGYTVTKKIGNAVVRNRIRRRLRAAAREIAPAGGRPGYDYVMVARHQALRAPFSDLKRDLARALTRLHDGGRKASDGASRRHPPKDVGPSHPDAEAPRAPAALKAESSAAEPQHAAHPRSARADGVRPE